MFNNCLFVNKSVNISISSLYLIQKLSILSFHLYYQVCTAGKFSKITTQSIYISPDETNEIQKKESPKKLPEDESQSLMSVIIINYLCLNYEIIKHFPDMIRKTDYVIKYSVVFCFNRERNFRTKRKFIS